MAQLWGGRFTKDTDRDVYLFNASIGYDKRLYSEDIKGSMVHARMLAKQGIITKDELEDIIKGLNTIMEQLEDGSLEITDEYDACLRRKREMFVRETRTRNAIHLTMISANGVKRNANRNDIQSEITLDDLFME